MKKSIPNIFLFVLLTNMNFTAMGQDFAIRQNNIKNRALSSYSTGKEADYNVGKDHRFLFGISAGGGAAAGMYDYINQIPPPEYSYLLVPAFGINLDWRLSRSFALQSNLLYKGKGDRIDMNNLVQKIYSETEHEAGSSVSAAGYTTTKIGYIEASLLPVVVLGKKVEIGVGGFAAYALNGERKRDFTLSYNFGDIQMPDETYLETQKAKFVTLIQQSEDPEILYFNQIDYGIYSHFGIRLNPLKVSLGVSYSLNTWEPNSKLSGILVQNYDLTRSISAVVLLSWFFGAH
jgi:hypothetical protein